MYQYMVLYSSIRHHTLSPQWLSTVKEDISLIWHAGDVGYADDSFLHAGCMAHFCYEQVTYLRKKKKAITGEKKRV